MVSRPIHASWAAVLVAFALFMASCGPGAPGTPATAPQTPTAPADATPGASPAAVTKLTLIQATPSYFSLPVYAAIRDFAAPNNVDITTQDVTGSGQADIIFAGGAGDMLLVGANAPLTLMQRGVVDVTVLGAVCETNIWALTSLAGSPYTSLESLQGRTIGMTSEGSQSHATLSYTLSLEGLDPDDYNLVAIGGIPELLAALEGGSTDASMLIPPVLTAALGDGRVQIAYDMREQRIPQAVIVARTVDVEANPEIYANWITAVRQAMTRILEDPEYALEVAKATFPSVAEEELEQLYEAYSQGIWDPNVGYTVEQYENSVSQMVDSGLLDSEGLPTYEDLTRAQP